MAKVITFQEKYTQEILPQLAKDLKIDNKLALPHLQKVVVNVGVGKFTKDDKYITTVVEDITRITGQKPLKTVAKKAIAGFKIREGNIVGVAVTLRGKRMFDFLQKLIGVALPRVRDFRGISTKGFDAQGNYSLGLREHIVFPEVSTDAVERTFPLEITVVTTAKDKKQGEQLLRLIGFPFEK